MSDREYTALAKLWRRHKAERAEPVHCRDCRHWEPTADYSRVCSIHNEATQAGDSCELGEPVAGRLMEFERDKAKGRMSEGGKKAGRGRPTEKGEKKVAHPIVQDRAPQSRETAGTRIGVSGPMVDEATQAGDSCPEGERLEVTEQPWTP